MEEKLNQWTEELKKELLALDWENGDFYAEYCAQTYFYVAHSTRLLCHAGARFDLKTENDSHVRFLSHAREELNHHIIAQKDLEKLGKSLEDYKELAGTQGFFKAQYYDIEFKSPFCLLGYILLLEYLAVKVGPQLYSRSKSAHGSDATNFLKVHAEEDPDHLESALKLIDGLDEKARKHVEENFHMSVGLFKSFLRDIRESSQN